MNNLTTLQSLTGALAGRGERTALLALQDGDVERWSYAELGGCVRRLAGGLQGSGVGRGDRVAVLAGNGPDWVAASLAVVEAGAVVVPLDMHLDEGTLTHALGDSGARLIFTTTRGAERIERLGDLQSAPVPVLLDAPADDERSWQRLMSAGGGLQTPEVEPDEEAALFYTSGTTGRAKGVPLTHANLAFQLNTLVESGLATGEDRVLLPLPLHHVYPFVVGMLTPLAIGLTVIMPHAMTGPQIVRALREGPATLIIGVPRLYEALYTGIEERAQSGGRIAAGIFEAGAGLGTWVRRRTGVRAGRLLLRPLHRRFGPELRVLASGGAPLDPETARKLEGLGWQVAIGYGLTETSPLLTLNPPGTSRLGSVGQPIPGVELRIDPSAVPGRSERSEDRTDRPGEEGEILARGPSVFSGYRNMPEETEKVLTDDGWFRTGDLGYFDEDGYLYVTGRSSTLIVTESGKNVQPEDVEEVYLESPSIREIGVLQRDGRLVALVVPEPSEVRERGGIGEAVREAIRERSRQSPSHQRISDYAITREPLEYTQLGKLRRHVLEERYERARAGEKGPEEAPGPVPPEEMSGEDRALLEDPAARQVWDWLAGRYPDERLTPDTSPQLDLGIDSLEWVSLTMEIGQRTGVELDEGAVERIETVRDLLCEVVERDGTGASAAGLSPLEHPEEVLDDRQKRMLRPLGAVESAAARAMFALNRAIARGVFRLRVEGAEKLPERGPLVVAPNHVSYLDAFAVAAALDYRLLRRTYWAGWVGAAFNNPLSRLVSRLARVVPVDPERAGTSSLAFGAAALQRQQNIVWFPEGERSPTGELQPFKPGVGVLLDHYRVPVVPVSIHGTERAMPPGRILPRPGRIRVVFGDPLEPDDLAREGAENRDRILGTLRDRVADLGRS